MGALLAGVILGAVFGKPILGSLMNQDGKGSKGILGALLGCGGSKPAKATRKATPHEGEGVRQEPIAESEGSHADPEAPVSPSDGVKLEGSIGFGNTELSLRTRLGEQTGPAHAAAPPPAVQEPRTKLELLQGVPGQVVDFGRQLFTLPVQRPATLPSVRAPAPVKSAAVAPAQRHAPASAPRGSGLVPPPPPAPSLTDAPPPDLIPYYPRTIPYSKVPLPKNGLVPPPPPLPPELLAAPPPWSDSILQESRAQMARRAAARKPRATRSVR